MFISRAAAVLLVFLVRAAAQTPPGDLTRCADADADISIGACTAFVSSAGESDDTLAKAFTYRGFSYLKKNQYDLAIGDFSQAIRLDPENAWALANRGNAYFNKHQYDAAMKDYDEALRLNPAGYATLFYGRGAIFSVRGEPGHAIEQFDQAIGLQPEFPEAFNNRGVAYFNNGQFSRAIDDYGEAIRFRPEYSSALQNRGNAYAARGQYDRAIEDYNKAIGMKPGPAAYRNRGNAYRAKGDYESAIRDLSAAIGSSGSSGSSTGAGALDDRGDTYLAMGQKARALDDFSEAVRLQPDDPDAFLSKGRAEFYLGQWNDAVRDFQKSLALDPTYTYAFIWLHLANARAGNDDAGSLEQQARKIQPEGWPAPIVDMFLGKLKPAYALAFASDPDSDKKMSQQCEAEFYVGEYILAQGDASAAAPHLQEARRVCSGIFAESLAAKMEMQRLEDGPKQ